MDPSSLSKVLLFGPDTTVASELTALLEQDGLACVVQQVESHSELAEPLATQHVVAILLDRDFLGDGGLPDLKELRRAHPQISTILLSSTSEAEDAVAAMKAGATDYILKHRLSRLLPEIRIALDEMQSRPGASLGALGTATDITDRRRAENALRKSEAQLRSIFENAAIGMCLVSMSGRIFKTNSALLKMLDLTVDELVGRPMSELGYDDASEELVLRNELIAGRREAYTMERPLVSRHGESLWTNVTVSLVRDDAGVPSLQSR